MSGDPVRSWLMSSPVAFLGCTPQGRITMATPAAVALLGADEARLVGRGVVDLLPERYDAEQRRRRWERLVEAAHAHHTVELTIAAGRVERQVEIAPSIDGDLLGMVLTDPTEQQELQDELLRLASFPELAPNATFEVTRDGELSYANAVAADLLDRPELMASLDAIAAAQESSEELVSTEGGEHFLLHLHPVDVWGRVRVYVRDITEAERARRELEQAHDLLERRVTERTEQLALEIEERRLAQEQAVEASRAKTDFLANMSHELRTPLNAILGYTELLLDDAEDPQGRGDLQRIHSAARHLLSLISDILDLSKVEAGRMEVHRSRVALADLLADVTSTAKPLVARNGNRLRVPDAAGVVLDTDATKVRQILINLLGNAAKFTERGTVAVELEVVSDWVSIAVVDTGVGIPAEVLPRLFEAFEQADEDTARRFGGTGLGLAISRRFAELLGGELAASSVEGEGSRFVLTLPRSG